MAGGVCVSAPTGGVLAFPSTVSTSDIQYDMHLLLFQSLNLDEIWFINTLVSRCVEQHVRRTLCICAPTNVPMLELKL